MVELLARKNIYIWMDFGRRQLLGFNQMNWKHVSAFWQTWTDVHPRRQKSRTVASGRQDFVGLLYYNLTYFRSAQTSGCFLGFTHGWSESNTDPTKNSFWSPIFTFVLYENPRLYGSRVSHFKSENIRRTSNLLCIKSTSFPTMLAL